MTKRRNYPTLELCPTDPLSAVKGPKDFNQVAWEVVQKAIGEMPKEG